MSPAEQAAEYYVGLRDYTVPGREYVDGPCIVVKPNGALGRDFWVDLVTNRYRCFKCHSAGRQLDLWAAVHHLNVHAAAEDICCRLGIPVPRLASRPRVQTSE
jgi:hypothetical protein